MTETLKVSFKQVSNGWLKGTGNIRFASNGPLKSLVVPFWRALRELENNEQFEQNWKHPVPQKEMDLLTNLVKTL